MVDTSVGQKAGELLSSSQLIGADKTLSYRGQDLMEQAKNLQELSNSSNRQLIWIASISLLVGGIGVMNIMLVTVTERTQEIGLKKAIGTPTAISVPAILIAVVFSMVIGIVFGLLPAVKASNLNPIQALRRD